MVTAANKSLILFLISIASGESSAIGSLYLVDIAKGGRLERLH